MICHVQGACIPVHIPTDGVVYRVAYVNGICRPNLEVDVNTDGGRGGRLRRVVQPPPSSSPMADEVSTAAFPFCLWWDGCTQLHCVCVCVCVCECVCLSVYARV